MMKSTRIYIALIASGLSMFMPGGSGIAAGAAPEWVKMVPSTNVADLANAKSAFSGKAAEAGGAIGSSVWLSPSKSVEAPAHIGGVDFASINLDGGARLVVSVLESASFEVKSAAGVEQICDSASDSILSTNCLMRIAVVSADGKVNIIREARACSVVFDEQPNGLNPATNAVYVTLDRKTRVLSMRALVGGEIPAHFEKGRKINDCEISVKNLLF